MAETVVVTGGCGFIGSHVVKVLSDGGACVVAVDSFQRYQAADPAQVARMQEYRAKHLLSAAEVEQMDVKDADAVGDLLRTVNPTHIVHAAGMPLATVARTQPWHAHGSILTGTFNMLEAARQCDSLQRFVYISSSMIYGNFAHAVMPETGPMRPVELYGGLKLAAEELVRCYSRMYKLPVTVVRPTSVYGPTDLNGRVVELTLQGARDGIDVRVSNPDSTFLDFSYVGDVADGIALATLRSRELECTFNISYGSARSLGELMSILKQMYPHAAFVPTYEADFRPNRGALNITRAREQLGFRPCADLETGLRLYNQFVEQNSAAVTASGRH
jgi:UDP-glucose 4-epimerase